MKEITSKWIVLNQTDGKLYVNGEELKGLRIRGSSVITKFIVKDYNTIWLFIEEK